MVPVYARMARNNAWCNEVLYSACAGLSAEAFEAPRAGFFPSLRATLTHIHEVDLYYLDALQEGGQGAAVYGTTPHGPATALGRKQRGVDVALIDFCDGLDAADLGRAVTTQRPGGAVPEQIGDLLPHLFAHQIHHRGQAHTMLSDAGVAPPQLDDFYLSHGRVPAAQAWQDHPPKEATHGIS